MQFRQASVNTSNIGVFGAEIFQFGLARPVPGRSPG